MALPFTPLAAALPASVPFVGPEAQERAAGRPFRARLGANENAFGPSPRAVAAMRRAAAEAWMYGDPENHDLKIALARHHDVACERIAVGEGIDALLQVLVRLFVQPGTPVVTSAGAYPTFAYHVRGFGGRLVAVPYRDDHEDPDALLAAAIASGAPLLYLANPDNPMGTWHTAERIRAMADALPPGTLLVLDEAYGEFAGDDVLVPMAFSHPQVIRLRTFSKAYAMAGARVGYAVASSVLAAAFDKVRNHFGVNRVAQAGALAALADAEHLAFVRAQVAASKARIAAIAAAAELRTVPSAANFVAIDTGADGNLARALVAALAARGVFVRMPFEPPQDRCIRVTAAPDDGLDVLEAALPAALAEARAAVTPSPAPVAARAD